MGLLLTATSAQAAQTSPWWHLTAGARPTYLPAKKGAPGELVFTAANLGDATLDATASPVVLEDALPASLKLRGAGGQGLAGGTGPEERGPVLCEKRNSNTLLRCSFKGTLPPFDQIEIRVKVETQAGAQSGDLNQLFASGGDAAPAQASRPLSFSPEPPPFGPQSYELSLEEEGGASPTAAGSHPFQLTTQISVNQEASTTAESGSYVAQPVGMAKDLRFHWPAGLLGDPAPLARCTLAQFDTKAAPFPGGESTNTCPQQTAVGVVMVTVEEPRTVGLDTLTVPIFNLEPGFGEPARLGFEIPAIGTQILIDPALRSASGGDYGLDVTTLNVPQLASVLSTVATVWGTPADPAHDGQRGWGCITRARGQGGWPCESTTVKHPPAFFTLPTSCSGAPLQSAVQLTAWADPLDPLPPFSASPSMPTLDGCNQLSFAPEIHSKPTTQAATTGSGLGFDLDFADEGLTSEAGRAESQLKKAIVTLPQGFTTNPSVAEGLKACTQAEYEAATIKAGSGCNGESKIGEVEVESPLIEGHKVNGGLFVARQGENPNHNLLTIYLIARNEELGIIVRQALKVTPDPTTGQLTTEVDDVPQLPFSHFHLQFRSGQRSPLITPPACGEYAVKALLYPYSQPNNPVERESAFTITQGPEGQPCPSGGVPPFHPNLEAGTTNNAAGAYSPFYTRITRKDSEQEITHFSIKLPPGVIGKLAGIAQCSDVGIAAAKAREHEGGGTEELASPSCPQASEIGHTLVGAGVGNVLAYAPGKLYLAGPYNGAPLSIVSITAAKVGPFDLGTVVVREALKVNPETAEVFVDATGSDPIPHIVDGIPVHLRDIRIYVNRPEFVLNPTSCEPTSTASTVLGSGLNFASEADDVPVTVTSRFQAADCAALPFAPRLALKLLGGTKRTGHPALKATLHMNGIGEAAIARAQVTLPKSEFLDQGHLNNICTRVQFKEGGGNGEKCPPASIYGFARAVTPILSEPLEGPVFLRSSEHQLPDLVAALHAQEINVDLVGRIDSLHGQIRNTFEAVPDAPVNSFTLEMQGGAKGLLINSTNLCQGTHRAIVDFTGHNGKLSDTTPAVGAKCRKHHRKGKHRHR